MGLRVVPNAAVLSLGILQTNPNSPVIELERTPENNDHGDISWSVIEEMYAQRGIALTDADKYEITANVVGFFTVLAEADRSARYE